MWLRGDKVELCDLLYVLLSKKFRGVKYGGKNVRVDYIYDLKVVDVATNHWILLYQTAETDAWFDIGASRWIKTERVSVDVRTDSKEAYGGIKNMLFEVFDGANITYRKKATYDAVIEEGATATAITKKGVYVRKVVVEDVSAYSEGEYVQILYADGSSEDGWIVDVYGNELLVFTREAIFFLVRPAGVTELSDRMRKLFRFVVEVEGNILMQ